MIQGVTKMIWTWMIPNLALVVNKLPPAPFQAMQVVIMIVEGRHQDQVVVVKGLCLLWTLLLSRSVEDANAD
jgi:hypothetical protein